MIGTARPIRKAQPHAARRDAWPPEGGPPGATLAFMRSSISTPTTSTRRPESARRHRAGHAQPGVRRRPGTRHQRLADRRRGPAGRRLKASIVVPHEDAVAAAAEIRTPRRRPEFRPGAAAEPHRRAARPAPLLADLRGGRASRPAGRRARLRLQRPSDHRHGWPSYYIEEMAGHSQCLQSALASLVLEGVFERFPKLKVVIIEGGFGWPPALAGGSTSTGAPARRGAASEAPAVGIYPRARLVHHPADGGAGEPRTICRRDRLDRLGPADVRHRLSALGFRRSVARSAGRSSRDDQREAFFSDNAQGAVPAGLMARHVVATADEIPPARASSSRSTAGRSPCSTSRASSSPCSTAARTRARAVRGQLTGLVRTSEPGEYRLPAPGEILRCPWHGWEFDIRTGQSYCDPRPRAAYTVRSSPATW